MKNILKKSALVIALNLAVVIPTAANAKCYADYKAKQSVAGLKLHYGIIQLPGGACKNYDKAYYVISKRLAKNGWTLLRIISIFDRSGLSQRQGNAGAYFLRY